MPPAYGFAGLACLAMTSLACADPSATAASSSSSTDAMDTTTTLSSSSVGDDAPSTVADDASSSEGSSGTTTTTDPSTSLTTAESDSTAGAEPCEDLGSTLPLTVAGTTATGADTATVVGQDCQLAWDDGDDATYVWSAPAAGWYSFHATPSDPFSSVVLSLFDGCGGESLQCQWRNAAADASTLAAELDAGQTVMIALDSMYTDNEGAFTLTIEAFTECGPAIDLGSELVSALPGDLSGQGDEVWAGCGWDTVTSIADVTYSWTAPETGIFTASVLAAGFSGSVTVYRGHCGSPSDKAACKNTPGDDGGVDVSFPAQEGELLTLVVDGFATTKTTEYQLDIVAVGPLAGDCCAAHDNTGCEDFDTVACACDVSADCCDPVKGWPEACAGIAGGLCGACAPQPIGDCCDPHDAYQCSNEFVSACACQLSGYCCADGFLAEPWSDICVNYADQYCNIDCP